MAWNAPGYRQVGAIADELLKGTTARAMVNSILNG
jgi:hypothetical protein